MATAVVMEQRTTMMTALTALIIPAVVRQTMEAKATLSFNVPLTAFETLCAVFTCCLYYTCTSQRHLRNL